MRRRSVRARPGPPQRYVRRVAQRSERRSPTPGIVGGSNRSARAASCRPPGTRARWSSPHLWRGMASPMPRPLVHSSVAERPRDMGKSTSSTPSRPTTPWPRSSSGQSTWLRPRRQQVRSLSGLLLDYASIAQAGQSTGLRCRRPEVRLLVGALLAGWLSGKSSCLISSSLCVRLTLPLRRVAQPGQRTRFGTARSKVRILPRRPFAWWGNW